MAVLALSSETIKQSDRGRLEMTNFRPLKKVKYRCGLKYVGHSRLVSSSSVLGSV